MADGKLARCGDPELVQIAGSQPALERRDLAATVRFAIAALLQRTGRVGCRDGLSEM
jgi:hypothetical protein